MKLSIKTIYSIKILLCLAANRSGHINITDIADQQNLSPRYVEQIMPALKKEGYIRSVRGTFGGYELLMEPAAIYMKDVVALFENNIEIVDPTIERSSSLETFLFETVYTKLKQTIEVSLSNVTLEALVQKYIEERARDIYYI